MGAQEESIEHNSHTADNHHNAQKVIDKLSDSADVTNLDAQDGTGWHQGEKAREAAKLAQERAEMRKERQEEAQERQAEKKREAAKLAQEESTEHNGHTSDNHHMTMSASLNKMGTDEFVQTV